MRHFYSPEAILSTESLLADSTLPARTSAMPIDKTAEEPAVAAFLDSIIGRLDSLPADMHDGIRRELRVHLDGLIAAHEELDLDHADAVAAAIGQFGDAATIARRFRRSYESTTPIATPWAAMRETLGVFGAGLFFYASLTIDAGMTPFGPIGSNGSYRFDAGFLASIMLWVFPILAGGWVGRRTPRRAALGVLYAIAALTIIIAPLAAYATYQVGNSFPTDLAGDTLTIAGNTLTLAMLPCLVLWAGLASAAAAVTSRIKWPTSGAIGTLPAFAARATGLGIVATLVNQFVHSSVGTLPAGGVSVMQYLTLPLMMVISAAVPSLLGWQIGRVWPITEKWTRTPFAYLLSGAATVAVSRQLLSAVIVWSAFGQQSASFHSHFHPSFAIYLFGTVQSFLDYDLPVAGIAALISANKARGGSPRLVRGVGIAALAYLALDECQTWFYRAFFVQHTHPYTLTPPPALLTYTLSFFVLAVFAVMLYALRRRLPTWNRLRAA